MPKKVEIYKCDVCGETYMTEEEAKACEANDTERNKIGFENMKAAFDILREELARNKQ